MDTKDKEELAQAIVELVETRDGVQRAVMSCARCSPNIVKVY